MKPNSMLRTGSALCVLVLGLSSIMCPVQAADLNPPDPAVRANWRAIMKQVPTPDTGCFHASYPSIAWESVDCTITPPRPPTRAKPTDDKLEVVGNGNDWVAQAPGLISSAIGSFSISGVTSEKSVGVTEYHDKGILGANEYTVQLNTNANGTTSACAGHLGCTVWQQFVYSTDYIGAGTAAVFIQHWLLNWGSSACPSGWGSYGSDCVRNSHLTPATDIPITDLGQVELTASVQAGLSDSVTLYYGSDAWNSTSPDSMLDISSVWNQAEFNVLGDAGGSRADFNSGSSIKVTLNLGSAAPLTCLAGAGTTGETNNLNLGSCKAYPGGLLGPYIQFSESN
jgi:hypothetical protein